MQMRILNYARAWNLKLIASYERRGAAQFMRAIRARHPALSTATAILIYGRLYFSCWPLCNQLAVGLELTRRDIYPASHSRCWLLEHYFRFTLITRRKPHQSRVSYWPWRALSTLLLYISGCGFRLVSQQSLKSQLTLPVSSYPSE